MHMTGIKDKMEKLHVIKNRSDQNENGEGDENEEQLNEIRAESEIRVTDKRLKENEIRADTCKTSNGESEKQY